MSFAAGLGQALQLRQTDVVSELDAGESLEAVLDRHLHLIEQMSDSEIMTSVLLLSPDGKRLTHGAAPNLPQSYREAIDGFEIGPSAGSCGTAAYTGQPVYVTDIATDERWAPYRHLALPHGLRSCWSTPIRDTEGRVIGTFAIYNRSLRGPTREELSAIDMITDKVAQAISWARSHQKPQISELLPRQLAALQAITAAIRTQASTLDDEGREAVDDVVAATEKLAEIVEKQLAASTEA